MASGIDHLIVAVPDPEAAAELLTERLGISFSSGGQHPGGGTFNRIAFLGEHYLELIGVVDPSLAGAWFGGKAAVRALEHGGGLATYALVEDDLEAAVARLQAAGSSIGAVTSGSRQRADCELVEWWTATPAELGPDRPPFLIKHARVGSEWGAEALAARREMRHPIGSPAILVRLDIATPDPPALAGEYAAELGVEFWAVADLAVSTVGLHTIRLIPSREMEVAAVIVIGADVEEARTLEALGLRFDVEPVKLPAALPAG
ncbi:MAG: VOC family protein [Chloroflexota bacterium]|nr:VOC family protein [Chloroflexota bacterium]